MIHVLGPRNVHRIREFREAGVPVIMTVSKADDPVWRGLSPFHLGPCSLYGGHTARNVENAWQFSKVYKKHTDANGDPTDEYFEWAKRGWADRRAHRYPMGRGAVPEYSWWDGRKLGYVQARKAIYAPLYIKAVADTEAWRRLKERCSGGADVCLWDYDAYDHRSLGMTYRDVLNDPTRKMGHAFVLAMMLECKDELVDMLEN